MKNNTEIPCTFTQYPPVVMSYITIVQCHNQDLDTDTIHDLIPVLAVIPVLVCVFLCLRVTLCVFFLCVFGSVYTAHFILQGGGEGQSQGLSQDQAARVQQSWASAF